MSAPTPSAKCLQTFAYSDALSPTARAVNDSAGSPPFFHQETMHPRLTELFDYMDLQAVALRAAYEAVPIDLRAVRPGPDRWSPAEVIGHLVLIERRLGTRFGALLDSTPTLGAEHDASPVLPSINLDRVLDRTQKISAPEPVQPQAPNPGQVWSEFEESRSSLKSVLARGDGLALPWQGDDAAPTLRSTHALRVDCVRRGPCSATRGADTRGVAVVIPNEALQARSRGISGLSACTTAGVAPW